MINKSKLELIYVSIQVFDYSTFDYNFLNYSLKSLKNAANLMNH